MTPLTDIIRTVLVADVTTNLFFVESNGRDRVSTRPEMFSGEVPFFALHSSNGYRALALDESNHRSDCVLEQGGDAHMHVIWHQMTFNDLAFFLPGQCVKDRAKLPVYFPIKSLAAIFGDENNMIFAIPLRVGQALVSTVHFVLLLVCLIKPPNENNI